MVDLGQIKSLIDISHRYIIFNIFLTICYLNNKFNIDIFWCAFTTILLVFITYTIISALVIDCKYCISVSYWEGKLSVFLEGIPMLIALSVLATSILDIIL